MLSCAFIPCKCMAGAIRRQRIFNYLAFFLVRSMFIR
jgi:hypothetical protein